MTREEVSAVLSRAFHPEKAHVVIAGTYPPKAEEAKKDVKK